MKRAIVCALLIAISPSAGGARVTTDKIKAKQAKIHQTHTKLQQKRGQLEAARARSADLQHQLSETNGAIGQVQGRLGALSAQVHQNELRLAWNKRQLVAAQSTLARHNDALKRRLVDAYEHGELGYLNVLLASSSFSDFVERWDDIRFLVAANQRTVRQRKAAEQRVAGIQRRFEADRSRLEASVAREQQVRSQLAALADRRRSLIAVAEDERHQVAQQVVELEETSAAEEAALQSLIVQRQREEAARRAAERRARQLAGMEQPEEHHGGGALSWPASGPITSGFGMRFHPIRHSYILHNGIDIAASYGATITAAAAGRVIIAGWGGGYGNQIVIDHGDGISTLYGHCSALFVSEGQDVQQGQAIGAVGSTGISTGPHLHFGVLINGVPVDPTTRLR